MNFRHPRIVRFIAAQATILVMGLAVVMAGCGKDDPPEPEPGQTMFRGAFTGASTGGCLSVVIHTASPTPQIGGRSQASVAADGSIRLYGSSRIDVTGTYDDAADHLVLSGGGWSVSGDLTASGMDGTFTGPQGGGVFSLQPDGSADTVIVFTGEFTSNTGAASGNFNFSIRGTQMRGHTVDTTGVARAMDGTFDRNDSTFAFRQPPGGASFATGDWHPDNTASGTYDNQSGDSGTWSGAKFN